MAEIKLRTTKTGRVFPSTASQALFPLGGIGTGNVSLGARGELRDWEIFNRPGKGKLLPYTFFSIWYKASGGEGMAKVLEAAINQPFLQSGHSIPWAAGGFMPWYTPGVPRLQAAYLKGEYPIATLDFEDDAPVKVSLTSFTPFCPSDIDFSSKPCAILAYRVKNVSRRPVEVSICGSSVNPVGYLGENVLVHSPAKNSYLGGNYNEVRRDGDIVSILMGTKKYPETSLRFGNMSIAACDGDISLKASWERTGWWSNLRLFWKDFSEDGSLADMFYSDPTPDGTTDVGSISSKVSLKPGEERELRFVLSWYFPNRVYNWDQTKSTQENAQSVRNYYATLFKDSSEVAIDALKNYDEYLRRTEVFRKAFFSTKMPWEVLETVSSQISTIRTNTGMVFADGTFWGYEGCGDDAGCCHGNCTHVWNYAQTMAFVFPELERRVRIDNFERDVDAEGNMVFRTPLPGQERGKMRPAADGQMGTIMRFYREWKVSGDDAFLRRLYPQAKLCLDFALKGWDADGDGVMEGEQHNTYDIEFFGANPLTEFFYLGALSAVAEMAEHLGEMDYAGRCRDRLKSGSEKLIEKCWNGEYFEQDPAVVDVHPYQHGKGCLSDQLLGQWIASLCGLGYLVPEKYVKTALRSIFKYNFKSDLSGHTNLQRSYAVEGEAGLVLCTWPRGGEPKDPFPYSDEVWTGIEFHVASHLLMESYYDEGMKVVKAIADRQNGISRNPWNHPECGHHYSRAMSSWGVLTALGGFSFDMVKGEIGFAPKVGGDDFQTFWAVGDSWGIYRQRKKGNKLTVELETLYGKAKVKRINLGLKTDRLVSASPGIRAETGKATVIHVEEPMVVSEGLKFKADFEVGARKAIKRKEAGGKKQEKKIGKKKGKSTKRR